MFFKKNKGKNKEQLLAEKLQRARTVRLKTEGISNLKNKLKEEKKRTFNAKYGGIIKKAKALSKGTDKFVKGAESVYKKIDKTSKSKTKKTKAKAEDPLFSNWGV